MVALPTFLPVSEAARKYGLEEARLRQLIERGKIRAGTISGSDEVYVNEEEVQKRAEKESVSGKRKEDLPEYSQFRNLQGKKINIRQASETYKIPFSTLRGWVLKGIIRKIEVTDRDIYLDEADVAYCSWIHKRKRGRGQRVFAPNGVPYIPKSRVE